MSHAKPTLCLCFGPDRAAAVAGVGIKQVSSVKQMLGKLTTLDSNNYPEMLGRTCIINAPPGFGMMFGMIKPFLDARTRAKVEVC